MSRVFWVCVLFLAGVGLVEYESRHILHRSFGTKSPQAAFYPALRSFPDLKPDSGIFRIAFFGSSITQTTPFSEALTETLRVRLGKPVKVYNFSCMGSLLADSYFYYKWLNCRGFDYVLVQQGLHEFRLNYFVRRVKSDLSDISWFRRKSDVDRFYHPLYQTPFALAHLYSNLLEKRGLLYTRWSYWQSDEAISWKEWNRNVAMDAYGNYLDKFAHLAQSRRDKIVLISTAHDFSKLSDRTRMRHEEQFFSAYSDTLKSFSKARNIPFVDCSVLSEDTACFYDQVHLTQKGIERFAGLIGSVISVTSDSPDRVQNCRLYNDIKR